MAEARQREAWWHTAWILAMIHNVNRSAKSEPVQPSDYHPFELERKKKEETAMPNPLGIDVLKIFLR